MPIYEFQCPSCGEQWDEIRSFRDPIPEACPSCSAKGVQKKVSAPAFHLKGSGWYATDSKPPLKEASAEAEKAPAKETSSESKKPSATKDSATVATPSSQANS